MSSNRMQSRPNIESSSSVIWPRHGKTLIVFRMVVGGCRWWIYFLSLNFLDRQLIFVNDSAEVGWRRKRAKRILFVTLLQFNSFVLFRSVPVPATDKCWTKTDLLADCYCCTLRKINGLQCQHRDMPYLSHIYPLKEEEWCAICNKELQRILYF